MPKLIVLTEGFKGQTCELKAGVTTIGRADDNAFCIPEGSVSGHHCEAVLTGNDLVIKDLNSTNGTYIDGNKITEAPLKAGMILRLGQCELKLDDGTSFKKVMESHRGGIKLEAGGSANAPANPAFKKKDNKMNIYILGGGAVVVIIILAYLFLR
ncbi:MAG: FHA domain-containing protein [Verrucomicrobia bacterium]|jgi:pSer/pThr/pTyr-binding forkhead associated (FHA) protein|nr:FHA domain-containing protein [Verrucomicrobiota bacterium]